MPTNATRGALRTLIGKLRSAVGDGVVLSRGDHTLAIDPQRVRCDVLEFEQACQEENWEQAVMLYRGSLLEGFAVSGAPEFERWLERERSRLRDSALRACRSSAYDAKARGAHYEAVRKLRRALTISPYDEQVARELIEALAATGDRAGALAAYEEFAARLEDDLEVEPGAETVALAEAVRASDRSEFHSAPVTDAVTADGSGESRRILGSLRVLGAVAIGGLTLMLGLRQFSAPAEGRHRLTSIAVLPFENLSPDGPHSRFAAALHGDLLTQLATVAAVKVISRTSVMPYQHADVPRTQIARELEVGSMVEGSVQVIGDRLRVNVRLVGVRDGNGVIFVASGRRVSRRLPAASPAGERPRVTALGHLP